MAKRIVLIQGHPDVAAERFCRFEPLGSVSEWKEARPPAAVAEAQRTLAWGEHLVVVFPLWLGDMPARLKAFFEQVFRPGFALGETKRGLPERLLKGRSAARSSARWRGAPRRAPPGSGSSRPWAARPLEAPA